MSVKSKLARQAVKTTAKHTAHGAVVKAARRPFRSITLLALGATLGGIVGWLIGRSGGEESFAPVSPTPSASSAGATTTDNSTEQSSETGAAK